ncbi:MULTISPECIES: ABC transporter permease family protein [Clostridium]|uniref:ABC transporter permease n=1 Tax=Clostridium nitritogenes TaxID=83340 RepID=A0ABP3X4D0_9CLOT|nr:hypothetical protein [Clostridium baratii]AQM59389.1 hypothetical protein NPD11_1245 [Clostridium baratii]KJU71700.1 hypothetical protein UC77_08270 [Clostridium baratii]MBT9831110.1 hypothetical protein [Clostridium baratii]MDY3207440.1 hypothetical protein [Clostridium baratii]STB00513.1 permease [Clostridium baratii]
MRRIIKEVIWNFKQSFISNIILIFQLSICFWLICMICNSFFDMGFKEYYKEYIKDGKIYYQLSFSSPPLINSDARSLENAKEFINELRNQDDFIYTKYNAEQNVIINRDEMEKRGVEDKDINQFIYSELYDFSSINLASYQMDRLGFEYFNFKMYDGRSFSDDDYILESELDKLPIILGYNYKDIFNIGEKIKYIYAGKVMEGEVIGILEKNSAIFNDNKYSMPLDNRIILPLADFKYIAKDGEEQFNQSIVYSDMLSANIIASINSSNVDITRKIYDLCNRYDFMKYDPSITASTNGLDMFKGESEQAVKIMFIMLVVMTTFCIFTFIMNMHNKIEKNMRRYLIQILQGASIKHIMVTYLLETFIVILLSLGISGYLLRKEITISYTFLLLLSALAFIVAIITSATIAYRIKNLDSDKLLRRE